MYRVVMAIAACLIAVGCSVEPKPLTLNLADGQTPPVDRSFGGTSLGDHAGTSASPTASATSRPRTAMLIDRAPPRTSRKAPPGALADRNYETTKLDVAKAQALINAYRKKSGLRPLALDAKLTAAAKAHSLDLAKWDRISHYGSDGSNPWDRVRRAGYQPTLAAENVGTGQVTLAEVFKGWQNSPGHNKNLLLKDARHMGIALVYDPKTEFKTFWTLVLGTKG